MHELGTYLRFEEFDKVNASRGAKVTSESGSISVVHKILFEWTSTTARDVLKVTVSIAAVEGAGHVTIGEHGHVHMDMDMDMDMGMR